MSGNKNVQVVLRVTISLKENVSAVSRQTLFLSASTEFNSARYFSKFSDLNSE